MSRPCCKEKNSAFDLYTDYYGAAPYYYETEFLNNVLFFIDGTSTVTTNVVNMYRNQTADTALEKCEYTVVDCGNHFNKVFYLKGQINDEEEKQSASINASSDESSTVSDNQNNNTILDSESSTSIKAEDDYMILDSGSCNANICWEIRSNGTLYIYGHGAVPSYEPRTTGGQIAPWKASPLVSEITDVVIGDGITGLGENLFGGLMLNTFYLGRNVRVYDHSFRYFYAANIYIPKCFKSIYYFLCDASVDRRADIYSMTVYYEGTEEDWNSQGYLGYHTINCHHFTVHYNYPYPN